MIVEEVRLFYLSSFSFSFYYADQLIACSWLLSSSQFSRWGKKMLNFKIYSSSIKNRSINQEIYVVYVGDFIIC